MEATSLINKFGGWTESYWFYVDSNNPIELRYDPKDHVYLLATDDGELEKQNGVTNVCHIIDKSGALVPWGCKMMAQKLITTAPYTGDGVVFTRAEFENFVLACKGAHKEKLEDAGAVGHIAHNWIEQYIKLTLVGDKEGRLAHRASLVELEERAQKACIAGLDWMKKHNVRWRATERKIYSRSRKYAGTMDGLCICDSCDDVKCCPNPFKDRLTIADWKTSNYLYMEYLFQTAAYQFAYQEEMNEVVEDRWIIRLGKEDGEFEAWHREAHNFDMDWRGFELALDLTRHVREVELNLQARSQALRAAIKAEKDAARATAKALEDEKKALAKAEAQQARVEALAKECPKAKKYKGMKAPTCGPCEACKEIYEAAEELRKVKRQQSMPKIEPKKPKVPDLSGLMAIVAKKEEACAATTSSDAKSLAITFAEEMIQNLRHNVPLQQAQAQKLLTSGCPLPTPIPTKTSPILIEATIGQWADYYWESDFGEPPAGWVEIRSGMPGVTRAFIPPHTNFCDGEHGGAVCNSGIQCWQYEDPYHIFTSSELQQKLLTSGSVSDTL